MNYDPWRYWRGKLAGGNPPLHEAEPQCGYFKVRDRRGLNAKKAPAKRDFVACAIWQDADGAFRAELAGTEVPLDRAWPWFARHPITHEEYKHWHQHESWPEKGQPK